MRDFLIVGLGGFLGSGFRFAVSGLMHRLLPAVLFPVGTLTVNLLGCFVIGLLGGWAENLESFSPNARLFLFLGVLGGFTTFSTFGYESMALLRDRQVAWALLNVGVHVIVGLGAVWAGYSISNLK